MLDENYWTDRYTHSSTKWDLGAVSPPLKAYFDQITDKNIRILIPGAGNAWEAEYLYQHGFTAVHVCDLSKTPLDNLRQRCPGFPDTHLIQGDFFEMDLMPFDLIVEQTFFCALDPSLRRKYFQKMKDLLKPGGVLMGVLFDCDFEDAGPPFGGHREEYIDEIGQLFSDVHLERCYNSVGPRSGRELFMILKK